MDRANLNWMLWKDGVEMAEFGMTRVRIGLFPPDPQVFAGLDLSAMVYCI